MQVNTRNGTLWSDAKILVLATYRLENLSLFDSSTSSSLYY